jgi:hypothetical protein
MVQHTSLTNPKRHSTGLYSKGLRAESKVLSEIMRAGQSQPIAKVEMEKICSNQDLYLIIAVVIYKASLP